MVVINFNFDKESKARHREAAQWLWRARDPELGSG